LSIGRSAHGVKKTVKIKSLECYRLCYPKPICSHTLRQTDIPFHKPIPVVVGDFDIV
jgi:hypothetical protein